MRHSAETSKDSATPHTANLGLSAHEGGKQILTRSLVYNLNGYWGMVNTPTSQDAESVASEVFSTYQFVRPQALYEILIHAFDNVANYGRDSGFSRGTVRVVEEQNDLVIRVENMSTSGVSKRLLDKPITPAAGILSLEAEERHPTESGGGGGLHFMTTWLPHIYRTDVIQTEKTGSLRWYQDCQAKDLYRITFELRIPIPCGKERSKLVEVQAEHQRLEQHWAAAEEVLSRWNEVDTSSRDIQILEAEIATCTRALESLANAEEQGEDIDFRDHAILEGLRGLGHLASSAAPALRRCMLFSNACHVSESVLLAVETDPDSSVQFFNKNLPEVIKKISDAPERDTRPLDAIASYANARGPLAAALQDSLLLAFDAGLANGAIAEALATIPLSELNRARVVSCLRENLARNQVEDSQICNAVIILAGQGELKDDEINLMIDGLSSKGASNISKALAKIPMAQPQIEHAKGQFEAVLVADRKIELLYLRKAVESCRGDKSVLFDVVISMLFDTRYGFDASKLIEQMELDPSKIGMLMKRTASELTRVLQNQSHDDGPEKFYYPLQIINAYPNEASAIQDILVDALIAGIQEFSLEQILGKIQIDAKNRKKLLDEVANRKQVNQGDTYYLEQVLKQ